MTTPISATQWQALRDAGHTDAAIMAHYHFDPGTAAAPPPLPGPAVPGPAASPAGPIDLSDGKFGVAEGRHPEDGRHAFKVIGFDRHKSHRDQIDLVIIEYEITASSNPANEIGGKYSKAYATRPRANDYGKSRDALKGLIADLAKVAIPGCRPETMASPEWNATVAAIVVEGKGIGIVGTLSTRTTKTQAGHDFVNHDWQIGKVEDVNARPAGPALTLPPMPAAAPPMPGLPPMPAPGLPPMPGAPPAGLGAKPPGWQGAWPPGGVP